MRKLRNAKKEQLLEILDLAQQIHERMPECSEAESEAFFSDCQQAAITVGEVLETVEGGADTVPLLEQYCEDVYQLAQDCMAAGKNPDSAQAEILCREIEEIRDRIREVPTVEYQVVFMPYKAAMWDSLESVWLACSQDKRCECLVMPLPYYSLDSNAKEWKACYEGNDFPDYVPVVSYQDYQLEQELPDVVYIHNPYDNNNRVTTVDPAYYSQELKKYAKLVVYIPYYVTSGFFAEDQMMLPVYDRVDYTIVQSERFKQDAQGRSYQEKLIPLGSPKIDRVIRMCREHEKGRALPEGWSEKLRGRKSVMLNTSLNCILHDGELYLKKIKWVFEVMKEQDKVALIWRPHPLLVQTMESMCPQLLAPYRELVKEFEAYELGIFDTTPDISETVAVADAYIGEAATSVINLYGAAGKPILILNNVLQTDFTEQEKRRIGLVCVHKTENGYLLASGWNGIYYTTGDFTQIRRLSEIKGQPKWCGVSAFMQEADDVMYLSPFCSTQFYRYHMGKRRMEAMSAKPLDKNWYCGPMVKYRKKLFYLPNRNDMIVEYDTVAGTWRAHTECIAVLKQGVYEPIYEDIKDYSVCGRDLWMVASYANRVLQFHMEDGSFQIHEVGQPEYHYSGIVADGDDIWLSELHTGRFVRWNAVTGDLREYAAPEEFRAWETIYGRSLAFSSLQAVGSRIVAIPGFSNGMVKLDKETGETTMLLPEFFEGADRANGRYDPEMYSTVSFAQVLPDGELWVQRAFDGALAGVNVEQETCEICYPSLAEEDYRALLRESDGFDKTDTMEGFYRVESSIFNLRAFLEELADGKLEQVKNRQRRALATLSANMDGTCGEKVHAFIMERLQELPALAEQETEEEA